MVLKRVDSFTFIADYNSHIAETFTETKQHIHSAAYFFIGTLTGLLVAGVTQLSVIMGVSVGVLFGYLLVVTRSLTYVYVALMAGTALQSVFILILERVSFGLVVPIWAVVLIHVLSVIVIAHVVVQKQIKSVQPLSSLLSELLVVSMSVALFARWPLNSPLSYLGFLSYEDNAGWISTASNFSRFHGGSYIDGAGGYVLDPLMASLHFIVSAFHHGSIKPSFAYQLVGVTYLVVSLMAVIAVGLATNQIARRYVRVSTALVLASGSSGLAYVACQLPRTTGHLTFIGGMAYVWALACIGEVRADNEGKSPVRQWLITVLILLGAVGMWWPLGIVAALFAVREIASVVPRLLENSRDRWNQRRTIVVGTLAAITIAAIAAPAAVGFRSMSVREFFAVKGGVQTPPGNSVIVGLIVFVALVGLVNYSGASERENSALSTLVSVVSLIGVLVGTLCVVSFFVGPDFTQNYTVQKTFLLLILLLIPLSGIAIVLTGRLFKSWASSAACFTALFLIGTQTVGWNLNDPRVVSAPGWGQLLLETADANPNAVIFCTTSDPARNMDAYLCSRHAAAVQVTEYEMSTSWRHLQVFPQLASEQDESRVDALKEQIANTLSLGQKVILLSLESPFAVADEDAPWMTQLPITQMSVVTPGA